jgi:hypothetical protein
MLCNVDKTIIDRWTKRPESLASNLLQVHFTFASDETSCCATSSFFAAVDYIMVENGTQNKTTNDTTHIEEANCIKESSSTIPKSPFVQPKYIQSKPKMTKESNKVFRANIKLYAVRLKNLSGTFCGVSDPFCIVTLLASSPDKSPKVLGRTEVYVLTLLMINSFLRTIELSFL